MRQHYTLRDKRVFRQVISRSFDGAFQRMRIFDLHCDWLLQYATETTLFAPSDYLNVPDRLSSLDGYLLGARAAILFCSRKPSDWAARSNRWGTLGEMLARYEAEFAGRLFIGPDDMARFGSEPADGLCWGMLGIAGLDFLVRETADLDRLAGAFERGVRVFQLVDGPDNLIGGSAGPGDERSLTELGLAVLSRLLEIAPPVGQAGARPVLDVAGLNADTLAKVLDWVEHDRARAERIVLLSSRGPLEGLAPKCMGTSGTTDAAFENLRRFRELGGVIGVSPGPPAVASAEGLRETIEAIASFPYLGRSGFEGIGVGTDFLRLAALVPELTDITRLAGWLVRTFGSEAGRELGEGTALRLVARAAGGAC
jgi:membrane dipeptidase